MLEAKDDTESQTRAENVRELKSSILSYMENQDVPTLNGFLEEIALYTDLEQYDQGADAVVMMTIHSAKGLEFPHVFLVGMEEGLFPGSRPSASRRRWKRNGVSAMWPLPAPRKVLPLPTPGSGCSTAELQSTGHPVLCRKSRPSTLPAGRRRRSRRRSRNQLLSGNPKRIIRL